MSAMLSSQSEDVSFAGKGDHLTLLENLGRAVAVGAEAGEDLNEISTGLVNLKVPQP